MREPLKSEEAHYSGIDVDVLDQLLAPLAVAHLRVVNDERHVD